MKITKSQLKQIIKEELGQVMEVVALGRDAAVMEAEHQRTRESVYLEAGLSPEEAQTAEDAISDPNAFMGFIETSAHDKLYNYFSEAGEIPYEIDSQSMKADQTPDEWIADTLAELPVQ